MVLTFQIPAGVTRLNAPESIRRQGSGVLTGRMGSHPRLP